MRVYYDRRCRVRGYSAGAGEAVGLWWLGLLVLPVAAVLYYFPRTVWRSQLTPLAKILVITGTWGALYAIGEIINDRTASQAAAAGCIDVASVPSWYQAPNSGAAEAKCASLTGSYVPRQGCTAADVDDPAAGTGGCSDSEKPRMVGGGRLPPIAPRPTLSLAAQRAACRGHQGPELKPFPPPIYYGPNTFPTTNSPYFIRCV